MMFRAILVLSAGLLAGCGDDDDSMTDASPDAPVSYADPAAIKARLDTTLVDLADFGEKRAGTQAGMEASVYLKDRFEAAGLSDVTFEEFTFSGWQLTDSSFTARIDATA